MKKKIYQSLALAAALTLTTVMGTPTAGAQSTLPAGALPMIVTPHNQSVSYKERTLCLDVTANIDYNITTNADWVAIRKGTDGSVYLHISANNTSADRVATILFVNAEKLVFQKMIITQGLNESGDEAPEDIVVKPSGSNANIKQIGEDIARTLDGNLSTLYHSPYGQTISESNPAILTYDFTNTERIDYVTYVPRESGSNGNFGQVDLYVKKKGDADYTLYGSYDWKESGSPSTITFDNGLIDPVSIRFIVKSGGGGFASCAEMQFRCINKVAEEEYAIFGDDVFSTLRPGVTLGDIEDLQNGFIRGLAKQLYEGNYETDYRVASYPCLLNVNVLSERLGAPGKLYDQTQGVTGISFGPGKHTIVVRGLPNGKSATLKIVAWYNGIVGSKFDGGDPQQKNFTLHNGINVIDYQPMDGGKFLNNTYSDDYQGLGYIDYNDMDDPDAMPDIKVHFVNGTINGYLSSDLTNEQMHEMTEKAPNYCMDVVGRKAHLVWTSGGLHNYCKANDGVSPGYRQFINVVDSLVQWEHNLLGYPAYGINFKNKTFAYVNFTYYMFQSGRGVSFHVNQESRILNCERIMNRDYGAIWGLSHEWGHQHQMSPYLSWSGLGEVSNNINSHYNVVKMGYSYNMSGIAQFANNDAKNYQYKLNKHGSNARSVRGDAVDIAGNYSYSADMAQLCRDMAKYDVTKTAADYGGSLPNEAFVDNTVIPSQTENKLEALSYQEVSLSDKLSPFLMVQTYLYAQGDTTFYPRLYQSLRMTNAEGSNDKYELIAAAQNDNKNGKFAVLKEKFPNSVWITRNYLVEGKLSRNLNHAPYVLNYIRKASRVSGYNLVPFFEQWGFLRTIAIQVGDYTTSPTILTRQMYDEFKADMDQLVTDGEIKAMPEGMLEEIMKGYSMSFPKPVIPN